MDSNESMVSRLSRWIAYASLFTAAYLITMGVTYVAVVHFGQDEIGPAANASKASDELDQLQTTLRDLRQLMRAYQVHIATEHSKPSATFTTWVAREFTPGLNEIRTRLQHTDWPSDAFKVLLNAADRMAAMANDPGIPALRETANEELTRAEDAVDQRVGAIRSGLALLDNAR